MTSCRIQPWPRRHRVLVLPRGPAGMGLISVRDLELPTAVPDNPATSFSAGTESRAARGRADRRRAMVCGPAIGRAGLPWASRPSGTVAGLSWSSIITSSCPPHRCHQGGISPRRCAPARTAVERLVTQPQRLRLAEQVDDQPAGADRHRRPGAAHPEREHRQVAQGAAVVGQRRRFAVLTAGRHHRAAAVDPVLHRVVDGELGQVGQQAGPRTRLRTPVREVPAVRRRPRAQLVTALPARG